MELRLLGETEGKRSIVRSLTLARCTRAYAPCLLRMCCGYVVRALETRRWSRSDTDRIGDTSFATDRPFVVFQPGPAMGLPKSLSRSGKVNVR